MNHQQRVSCDEIVRDIQRGSGASGRHHFITGLAGAGKTTLLREAVSRLRVEGFDAHVISATGLAANIADGTTLMGFFGLEFDTSNQQPFDNSYMRDANELANRMEAGLRRKKRLSIFKEERPTVLAFDEVVTLHNTVLEGIDILLRKVRKTQIVFGGVPCIFCGDVLQLRGAEPSRHGTFGGLPVLPVWESAVWKKLDLRTYYLTSFLRGCREVPGSRPGSRGRRPRPYAGDGTDTDYLNLLAEMRIMDGNGSLSERSAELVSKLQDREGEHEAGWTALCIYRSRAHAINDKHLASIAEPIRTFQACESLYGDLDEFNDNFTVKREVKLKKGCRALVNTNIPGTAFNGDFGDVIDFVNAESHVSIIPEDPREYPGVKLRLDRTNEVVEICPLRQEVKDADGKLLFQRTNLPLELGAAVTCHKVIGCTLGCVVIDLAKECLMIYVSSKTDFNRLRMGKKPSHLEYPRHVKGKNPELVVRSMVVTW
ncbi:hypothetical protein FOL47_001425 [Perkinsus chesapeaki]|uniref:ATP-dependent DNA helicase n=1 Tax=Perkinsus chesapeaki TaxID=330153 RepID=A0A7J6KS58_PERCH|nr:hypothetical protein FOL47_001425 [Perkinsus chesapeaki]